ncbi:hypothetical protein AC579_3719 [Pseudocercospora musae]|uniref:Uncharacterized protein n=1 Tax=Pseudocercospora musae TaxID=113226 RepID=A0A139IIS9_9PEZI|nr:hypothetical protein AC579_3719 [Pseudocercospora musae]
MNLMIVSYQSQLRSLRNNQLVTYPALTLMFNTPTINREPPPILLNPGPFERHISSTHEALPQVIETVLDMILLRRK